ncbi:hypothetical protein KIL84_010015 [Mauremys mutica]|uniref:Uncharacterized protein n=1 Tax=Mauremys mutica TaxID=74926 RepID=A0A9D3XLX8_9SAUR|nr:hypothetical protein KIL84_010015 [Mauremys mutica]
MFLKIKKQQGAEGLLWNKDLVFHTNVLSSKNKGWWEETLYETDRESVSQNIFQSHHHQICDSVQSERREGYIGVRLHCREILHLVLRISAKKAIQDNGI